MVAIKKKNLHLELHRHNPNTELVLEAMPQAADFEKAAETFAQVADDTRLKILWLLAHSEECVNNIALAVNMSAPAVSHHLRLLRQVGLISNRRDGKEIYYKLANNKQATLLHKIIDNIFEMDCNL